MEQNTEVKISASYPTLTNEDIQELHKVVDQKWYTEGKWHKKFQRDFNKVTQSKHTLIVNSGSSANLVAVRALLDKYPGKLVITCAMGFPTTVTPIYQFDKVPIYVDIDPVTLSPDIGQIAYVIEEHGNEIAGAILAHNMGFPFDERLVRKLLGEDRFFITDCCDALGAGFMISGTFIPVGHWSDASTYSFFPAHHIMMAEGGAITCNDDDLEKDLQSYINWGRDCYCAPGQSDVCGNRFGYSWDKLPPEWDHKYTFTKLGYNLKATEFQAALGYSQIQRLQKIVDDRCFNVDYLYIKLNKYNEYMQFISSPNSYVSSPFGFPIFLREEYSTLTNDLIEYLEEEGISTRRFFGGNLTRQPAFQDLPYIYKELPGADFVMENGFWIGCHPNITNEMINYIENIFENYFVERGLY